MKVMKSELVVLVLLVNKYENKLPGEDNEGIQNFRFINVDDTILHGATVELNYQITALNMSEIDYISNELNEKIANNPNAKAELINFAKESQENYSNPDPNSKLTVGKYLGSSYYTGNVENETPVTTRVRQVVDYVDNDAVFAAQYNNSQDHMWKPTNITELTGNGYDHERILDRTVLPAYSIVDKDGREYLADATSVEFTRNPKGLISALRKLDADNSTMKNYSNATAHMYINDPNGKTRKKKKSSIFSTHPSIDERIARLEHIN